MNLSGSIIYAAFRIILINYNLEGNDVNIGQPPGCGTSSSELE